MAEATTEQDKSEEATPFKLQRARRKGQVARGMDLGFVSALIALAVAAQLSGTAILEQLALTARRSLGQIVPAAGDTQRLAEFLAREGKTIAAALVAPAVIVFVIVLVVEIVQIRGIVFTAAPLKPDFSRLNPAKGLKRLISPQMLRQLLKNVVKFVLYCAAAFLFICYAIADLALRARDGRQVADLLAEAAGQLLLLIILLAASIALIDQLLSRREFARQMRMSRRELTREQREREGEPRQKHKRKQILDEILQQAGSVANVRGSDVLIVNPAHYAVALRYQPGETEAPVVRARGRNAFARRMRKAAHKAGVAIVRHPRLARGLYHECRVGQPIARAHFVAVADIYIMLHRSGLSREERE